ncbi:MAG: MFS transporter [Alphaproteobacteria bacterium]|nr:MFS transporter [Alphaproteobacteria bacterium]
MPAPNAGEATPTPRVGLRTEIAVYGIGAFSTTMHFMAITIVPLWVVGLDLSPFLLGIVLGSRPVASLFLSIHIGALMDKVGGRRVMLFFAVLGTLAPVFYPLMPWVWAVILLQMLWGLADSMGWLGAQTLVGQVMGGRTVYAGRLSVVSRIGNFVGPPMAGAAWDIAGPWAAFGLAALWGSGTIVCNLLLPEARAPSVPAALSGPAPDAPTTERSWWSFLIPDPADYVATFRLLAAPTVAITVAIGMMTHVGNNIQSSFYVVWLNQSGISGTLIGLLFALSSVTAGIGPLLASPLSRRIKPYWLLWSVVWIALVLIAITPVLGVFVMFAVVLLIRSFFNGIHQPLVITLTLRTAGPGAQGKAIGLRATANRVTSILAPVLMGAIAQIAGIALSFYILGVLATAAMLAIAVWMLRHPEIHDNAREG